MFCYDEETRYVWINGASLENEKQFELVGTVIGLALYNGVILGVNFPRVLYKKLLDEEIDLEDVKLAFPVCVTLTVSLLVVDCSSFLIGKTATWQIFL